MADQKLSALAALAVEMANTDEIYLNDAGVSKRQLYSVFKAAFALSGHTHSSMAASDGSPDPAFEIDTAGDAHFVNSNLLLDNTQYVQWKAASGAIKNVFSVNGDDDVVYKAVLGKDHIFVDSANNEIMRLTDEGATGNVQVTAGNLIIATADRGIDFSANSNAAGSTSELFDYYEEVDHVATVVCATSGSYTLDAALDTLACTRKGRNVHVQGRLSITGESSPSGALRVSIPYTSAALIEGADTSYVPVAIINHGGTILNPQGRLASGVAYITLRALTDAGNISDITEADVDTAFFINVNFSYIAA